MSLALALSLAAVREPLGGSSPPPGYTTGAVSFDGQNLVYIPSLVSVDDQYLALSYWVYFPASAITSDSYWVTWIVDTLVNYETYDYLQGSGVGAANYAAETGRGPPDNYYLSQYDPVNVLTDTWLHYLEVYQTNFSAGNKIAYLYRNGVLINADVTDASPSFNNQSNGLPFFVGNDGFADGLQGYMADFVYMPGVDLLTNGAVSIDTLANFIVNGKPASFDNILATYNPAIALRAAPGDPNSFSVNQGSGGDFTTRTILPANGANAGAAGIHGPGNMAVTGLTLGTAIVQVLGFKAGVGYLDITDEFSGVGGAGVLHQSTTTDFTGYNVFVQVQSLLTASPSSPSD